jgi:beta-N-acetylhexosaminidase
MTLRSRLSRFLSLAVVFVMLFQPLQIAQSAGLAQTAGLEGSSYVSVPDVLAQTPDPNQQAKQVLAKMTPDEKVGQLFLVTFNGQAATPDTQIYDLLVNHHVGGVMLSQANDNFSGPDNTVKDAYDLIAALQTRTYEGSQKEFTDTRTKQVYNPQYIPLFIGISQDGDGTPYDQILNGMTQLPNEMAIGATWETDLSRQVGTVLGKELSVIGFNLLFGPSLDVVENAHTDGSEDIGSRTFGGDPFWVGEMGKAYISGIHEGSDDRIAVIAKNFPGRGSSDRPPDEEVATVRKSLDQLKLVELVPFFATTGNAKNVNETTNGLLVTHIRYPFQGNIRSTTRPVSLDQEALDQLMAQAELSSWRTAGGILVSDNLGSTAVKKFYSPANENFDSRQVARDAFLAGNDLLDLGDIQTTGDPDSYTSIINILTFFSQKYREDAAFAQRVDASVERLLTLKFKIYHQFTRDTVQESESGLANIGLSDDVSFKVAQASATLLSPDSSELDVALSRPPTSLERIVFVTDTLDARQCEQCAIQNVFPADALQKAVLKLYGSGVGAQVQSYNLKSYSFSNLSQLLIGQSSADFDITQMSDDIRSADWIVFSMAELSNNRPQSWALRNMLSQRPDLIRNKKVLVFAFNAPYYLDATDISKITAYYGLFSKSQPFIDLAARLLFQETVANGALPVSVSGVGYDLLTATSPDPSQVISLTLDMEALNATGEATVTATPTEVTPVPTAVPTFKVGDTIPLRTGIVYDQNHHPVPDGTVVRFNFLTGSEGGTSAQQVETVTTQGIAHTTFRIQNAGLLEISVASDPARTSEILKLDVTRSGAAAITEIAPTPQMTETASPSPSPTNTEPVPTSTPEAPPIPPTAGAGSWFMSMVIVWGVAFCSFWVARQRINLRWGVRWGLLVAAGGQFVYILYFLIAQPTPKHLVEPGSRIVLFVISLFGCLLGGVGCWQWKKQVDHQSNRRGAKKITSQGL